MNYPFVTRKIRCVAFAVLGVGALLPVRASAAEWTMWGGTPNRNMVSQEKNPPINWNVDPDDPSKNENVKWVGLLGSKSYGSPIVANGVVCVGTNNFGPNHDKAAVSPSGKPLDGGVEMAFDEASGKFAWLKYYSKLQAGRVNDWPGEGLCATGYAEPGRYWYATNQCHVVCLDLSPGAPKLPDGSPPVLWDLDMMAKLGVFPHNMTASSIASYGDYIYLLTGNGVEDTHKHVVAPNAPGIVCLNKNTGAVIWTDNSPGPNVLHGQWASVAIAENSKGEALVIAPMGDAWVRAFDAKTGKLVWKFDINPKDSIYPQTRNEIIATPAIVDGKMYLANGQDPEHGTGYGHMWCVDINGEGDVSAELDVNPNAPKPGPGGELIAPAGQVPQHKGKPNPNSKVVWHFHQQDSNGDGKFSEPERMHRTICTASVYNGLCFIPDFSGYLHCLDANTGKVYWNYDMEAEVWGSPMSCDGKVYLGDGDGNVRIFAAEKQMKLIAEHNMGASVFGTPVIANGTLYILSMQKLFAIQEKH